MTHTYAVLEVSREAHAEVRALLLAAGYGHAMHGDGGSVIDMHGIALQARAEADTNAAEGRLSMLIDQAFKDVNHPALLDWVALMFERRALLRLHDGLSVLTACSSPGGTAELGQVEMIVEENQRLRALLKRVHDDVQHDPEYAALKAEVEAGLG